MSNGAKAFLIWTAAAAVLASWASMAWRWWSLAGADGQVAAVEWDQLAIGARYAGPTGLALLGAWCWFISSRPAPPQRESSGGGGSLGGVVAAIGALVLLGGVGLVYAADAREIAERGEPVAIGVTVPAFSAAGLVAAVAPSEAPPTSVVLEHGYAWQGCDPGAPGLEACRPPTTLIVPAPPTTGPPVTTPGPPVTTPGPVIESATVVPTLSLIHI